MKRKLFRNSVKLAIIVTMLMMVLLLCGCRQRVTNNDEVSNTLYDPDGSISYDYQYRRDELGLNEAKRPIFPNLGSSTETEDEENYDDYGELDEFEDIASQDEEEYDDEDHSTTSRTGRQTNRIPQVNRGSGSSTTTNSIKVTLDPNGGKAEYTEMYVLKDKTYGSLPEPEYAGYTFLGWFTEKEDGTEVTSKTKVTTDKAHTLYAHWKEANTYTVTFDPNGGTISGDSTMVITARGKYGYLPVPTWSGYLFDGWYTDADGGSQVKKGDAFNEESDITLYAHWKDDPYAYWEKYLGNAASEVEAVICYVDSAGKTEKAFLSACKATLPKSDESPAYVIKFVDKMSEADSAGSEAASTYPNAVIIVAPSSSLDGSKNETLYYKYLVFTAMHGDDFVELASADDVKSDLEIKDAEIKIYNKQ